MVFKNEQIIIYLNSAQELANVNLPVQIAYAIKKNHRKMVAEYKDYEEQLMDLRTKYPDWKNSKEYDKEIKALMSIETDVDVYKIPEVLFESGDFSITAKQLEILEFMIEIE